MSALAVLWLLGAAPCCSSPDPADGDADADLLSDRDAGVDAGGDAEPDVVADAGADADGQIEADVELVGRTLDVTFIGSTGSTCGCWSHDFTVVIAGLSPGSYAVAGGGVTAVITVE